MKNQKGISILIGIIVIVAVAVLTFGGVFAYQYFVKPAGLPVQSQQATEGWKTFSDSRFPFEFRYPSEWKDSVIKTDVPNISITIKEINSEFGGLNVDYKPGGKLKLEDFFAQVDEGSFEKTEFNINGRKAVKLIYKHVSGIPGAFVVIDRDNYGNFILLRSLDAEKLSAVISTIKFIEVKDLSLVNKMASYIAEMDAFLKTKLNLLTTYGSEYFIGDDQSNWCYSQKLNSLKKNIINTYGNETKITCSCGTSNCNDTYKWCVSVLLSTGNYYCVDSGAQRFTGDNLNICMAGICKR